MEKKIKFYPTYKCKNCGEVETDYNDGRDYLYNHNNRLSSDDAKIHVCAEFEGCKTIGVMTLIGFHQRGE